MRKSEGAEWAKARPREEPRASGAVRRFVSKRKPWWRDGRQYPEHLFLPDTQIKAGVPIEHVRWAAQYALEKQPDVIVVIGDWWDFPSLNSYEVEWADFKTRDLVSDICAGLHGWDLFIKTLRSDKRYDPLIVFCEGNHDERASRTFRYDRRLSRGLPLPRYLVTRTKGVEWIPFLEIACVDDVHYSHFFAAPLTGKPIGGTALNRLNRLKFTHSQGHVQVKETAEQHLSNGAVVRGLVAGAFYQHDEEYRSAQANSHFRGVIYKHEVRDGNYDLMEVSMDYLRRRYGGKRVLASGTWRAREFTYEDDES